MRTLVLAISLFVSAFAFAQVPSVKVENSKGESFDTKALLESGKPMIVSFWSTSCKPCIRELDAIYDALLAVSLPAVEVHLTDINQRDEFRKISVTAPACKTQISGYGFEGYKMAIEYLIKNTECYAECH